MDQKENFNLKDFYESVVMKEKKSRRRMIILTVIPVLVGIAWYSWSAVQVQEFAVERNAQANYAQAYKKMAQENKLEAMALKEQVEVLKSQAEIKNPDAVMPQTVSTEAQEKAFRRFLRGVSTPEFNDVPGGMRTKAVQMMFNLRDRNVRFHKNGRNIREGFDSYTLLNYVLYKSFPDRFMNNMEPGELKSRMTEITSDSRNGDVIFYEDGTVMIYVHSYPRAFCIGMTEYGVMTMEPEFKQVRSKHRIMHIVE